MEYLGTSEQQEKLSAIGTRLSEERQKQSVSLEEIAAKTYIPLRLLSAIESGQLKALPEPVFIQGFIRRYAEALGLDGATISKEFPVNLSPVPIPEPSPSQPKPLVQPAVAPPKPKVERQFQMPTLPSVQLPSLPSVQLPSLPSIPRSTWVATGIGAAIVVGLISIVSAIANRPKTAQAPAPVKPPETRSASIAPPANPPASPVAAGVSVKVNITEESWAEILVDGKSAFEGTLAKGTQRAWNGKKQIVVSAGNAGGVSVSYNNGATKPMGGLGEVKEMRFPPTP